MKRLHNILQQGQGGRRLRGTLLGACLLTSGALGWIVVRSINVSVAPDSRLHWKGEPYQQTTTQQSSLEQLRRPSSEQTVGSAVLSFFGWDEATPTAEPRPIMDNVLHFFGFEQSPSAQPEAVEERLPEVDLGQAKAASRARISEAGTAQVAVPSDNQRSPAPAAQPTKGVAGPGQPARMEGPVPSSRATPAPMAPGRQVPVAPSMAPAANGEPEPPTPPATDRGASGNPSGPSIATPRPNNSDSSPAASKPATPTQLPATPAPQPPKPSAPPVVQPQPSATAVPTAIPSTPTPTAHPGSPRPKPKATDEPTTTPPTPRPKEPHPKPKATETPVAATPVPSSPPVAPPTATNVPPPPTVTSVPPPPPTETSQPPTPVPPTAEPTPPPTAEPKDGEKGPKDGEKGPKDGEKGPKDKDNEREGPSRGKK